MKKLHFCKMHGLGNDFMLINAIHEPLMLEKTTIVKLPDRKHGLGFDQVLVLRPSKKADLYCQIFNADGSEAEQCGNGLRCVARYAQEEKIISQAQLTIETKAGLFQVEIEDYDQIRVNMGLPQIQAEPLMIALGSDILASLKLLSLGNPHAIYRVEACQKAPVSAWGAIIEKQPAFPQGVNVGFMEVVDRKNIRLRTYERGAGETLACGSNACAAAVAGIAQGWLDSRVVVALSRGNLEVEWTGKDQAIFLTGPATRVFTGVVELE